MGNGGRATDTIASKMRAFFAWLRSRPRRFTIPAAVLIVAAVSLGGYKGIDAYNYMQHDPNFCRSCHIMEKAWDRWLSSKHRSVNCHSCHHLGVFEGPEILVKSFLGRPAKVAKHAVVPDGTCKQCHESGNPRWVQVAATSGHQVHAEKENIACIKCHSITLHRFTAPGPICIVCHEDKHMEVGGMSAMHCTTCHQYLIEEEQLLPLRESCLDCHRALTDEGVQWPIDGPMQFPCGQCHQPHEQAKPLVNCLSCHPDIKGLHKKEAHSSSECQICHQPHQWQATERQTCLTCHSDKEEHNLGTECAGCHSF